MPRRVPRKNVALCYTDDGGNLRVVHGWVTRNNAIHLLRMLYWFNTSTPGLTREDLERMYLRPVPDDDGAIETGIEEAETGAVMVSETERTSDGQG